MLETAMAPEALLSHDEVLKLVGVSRKTLWAWRRLGVFPPGIYRNLGGALSWRRSEVFDWLERRNHGSLKDLAISRWLGKRALKTPPAF